MSKSQIAILTKNELDIMKLRHNQVNFELHFMIIKMPKMFIKYVLSNLGDLQM